MVTAETWQGVVSAGWTSRVALSHPGSRLFLVPQEHISSPFHLLFLLRHDALVVDTTAFLTTFPLCPCLSPSVVLAFVRSLSVAHFVCPLFAPTPPGPPPPPPPPYPLDSDGASAPFSSPPCATVKVWRLDGREAGSLVPVCVRTFRVLDIKSGEVGDDVAVTALSACEDLSQIAVGLSDGSVLLFRGEFHRDRGSFKREVLQVNVPWR